MQFTTLETAQQLQDISSSPDLQAILKHNTTCPISKGVLDRLRNETGNLKNNVTIHVLDLLANRELSNAIADRFGVTHQSPQVLLVQNGRCIYHEWGFDISAEALEAALQSHEKD